MTIDVLHVSDRVANKLVLMQLLQAELDLMEDNTSCRLLDELYTAYRHAICYFAEQEALSKNQTQEKETP